MHSSHQFSLAGRLPLADRRGQEVIKFTAAAGVGQSHEGAASVAITTHNTQRVPGRQKRRRRRSMVVIRYQCAYRTVIHHSLAGWLADRCRSRLH